MPEHRPPYMSLCIEFTVFKGQKNLRLFERSELERNTNYNMRTDTYTHTETNTLYNKAFKWENIVENY